MALALWVVGLTDCLHGLALWLAVQAIGLHVWLGWLTLWADAIRSWFCESRQIYAGRTRRNAQTGQVQVSYVSSLLYLDKIISNDEGTQQILK